MSVARFLLTVVGLCVAINFAAIPDAIAKSVETSPLPGDGASSDPPELTGEITLRDAVATALVRSPELSAFSAEVRAREARILQAGLLPNPALRTEVEDFAGTGGRSSFKSAQTTISLAQLVELGGKRLKRRQLASLDRDLAGWDYEAKRASVLADVTRAFVTTLAAQERLRLADDLLRIASDSVGAVGAQVRAGAVSPIEEQRAGVVLARTRVERVQLEHELTASRAALAATWGAKEATFASVRGELTQVTPPAPETVFLAQIDKNPDLARWATEIAQRRAAIALEESRRIPDVTIALGGRRFNEDENTAAVFEMVIPLPVFDRNQGGIAEAQERLTKAKAEQAATLALVRSDLTRAYQELHAAFDQVTSLRDEVIPRADSVYQGARDAYAKGLFRYLEVLDAQRTLFELRSQYLQALATYHHARADVERLSGVAVDEPSTRRDHP